MNVSFVRRIAGAAASAKGWECVFVADTAAIRLAEPVDVG